jgi:hypothetical protein
MDDTWIGRWLKSARITDNPEGDLIADMRREFRHHPERFPRLFANIGEMRSHLKWQGACREAMQAAPGVWRRYKTWLDRHPSI